MTPGYKSTEWWLSLIVSLLGVAGTLGFLTPDQTNTLSTSISQIFGAVIAIVSVVKYIGSRTSLKAASIAAAKGTV